MHINQCPHSRPSILNASNLRIFYENSQENSQKKLHTLININLLIPKSPHPPHIYTIRKLPLKKTAKAPETESEAPPLYQNKRWIINPYSPHCIQTTHHCSRHTPVVRLHCQHANAHCNANLLHQYTEFPSPYHLFHQIPSHRNW